MGLVLLVSCGEIIFPIEIYSLFYKGLKTKRAALKIPMAVTEIRRRLDKVETNISEIASQHADRDKGAIYVALAQLRRARVELTLDAAHEAESTESLVRTCYSLGETQYWTMLRQLQRLANTEFADDGRMKPTVSQKVDIFYR